MNILLAASESNEVVEDYAMTPLLSAAAFLSNLPALAGAFEASGALVASFPPIDVSLGGGVGMGMCSS